MFQIVIEYSFRQSAANKQAVMIDLSKMLSSAYIRTWMETETGSVSKFQVIQKSNFKLYPVLFNY